MKLVRDLALVVFVGACVVLIGLTIRLAFEEVSATSSSAGYGSFLVNVESTPESTRTPLPTAGPGVEPAASATPGPTPTFDSSSTGDF